MVKYKVLSASKRNPSARIVEAKGLTKSKAKLLAKKERGFYCGLSEGSPHKKHRKPIKGYHCYRLYSKVVRS